ncbi:protein of unknown function [Burkholderia multivorans]
MAELVDALGSGPSGGNTVEVRVLSWAPSVLKRSALCRPFSFLAQEAKPRPTRRSMARTARLPPAAHDPPHHPLIRIDIARLGMLSRRKYFSLAALNSVDISRDSFIISFFRSAVSSHAKRAQVAELVDALGSGPSGGNTVEVRVLSWAPSVLKRSALCRPFSFLAREAKRPLAFRADSTGCACRRSLGRARVTESPPGHHLF